MKPSRGPNDQPAPSLEETPEEKMARLRLERERIEARSREVKVELKETREEMRAEGKAEAKAKPTEAPVESEPEATPNE